MRQPTAAPAATSRRTIGSGPDLSTEVTVFVTTVGAPTFADCMAHLEAQDATVSFELLDHVAPLTAALQQMADRCSTPYYVQVDEDMLLDADAVRRLYDIIRTEWHEVAIVVGLLDDDHLGRPIEGIKINRLAMVRDFDWRIHGSVLRRNAALAGAHYKIARRPLKSSGQKLTFGKHVIGRDPRMVFDRYRDLERLRRAAPEELDWFAGYEDEFLRRYRDTGDAVDFFALMGILTAGAQPETDPLAAAPAKDFRRRDADAAFDAAAELWRTLQAQHEGGGRRRVTLSDEGATARLGEDLAALTAEVEGRLLAATTITGLRALALERQTFKLRFAGGLVLKGRRMDRVEDAERAFRLGLLLDRDGFSRPIAQRGVALLEPWIAGTRIDLAGPGDAALRECGRLLGTVHSLAVDLDGETRRWQPAVRLPDVEARLDQLCRLDLVSARTRTTLTALARASAPDEAVVGVVHRDFWPRNVVVDAAGRPHVIDNASISIGAHAFDQSRTAYLWPMDDGQRAAFDDGYRESAPRPPTDSVFWKIDVLSEVALFRRLAGARGVSKPVTQLRRLAASA